jgi:GT2 family glycosyltransferase
MRFSIVTPVLNGMPWLPECARSVRLEKESVDLEHIILDGGSSDTSREWLTQHRDFGFQTILEPDRDQTDALIKGFHRASGEIFGWLNADDVLEQGALTKVGRVFEQNPDVVLVSGCCALIDPQGSMVGMIPTPLVESHEGLLAHPTNLAQPATFFRASTYREIGGLDRRFDLAMDVDLWLRLAKQGRIVFLRQDMLARFRIHPAAKSVVALTRATRQDFAIRRRNGLRVRSGTGLWFVRRGYIAPLLHPITKRIGLLAKSILSR